MAALRLGTSGRQFRAAVCPRNARVPGVDTNLDRLRADDHGVLGTFRVVFQRSRNDHPGASGIVFGWLAYLLVRGLFTKRLHDILIAIIVFLIYGSVLWGVLPGAAGVSWQAHLGGAVGGVISASRLARHSR